MITQGSKWKLPFVYQYQHGITASSSSVVPTASLPPIKSPNKNKTNDPPLIETILYWDSMKAKQLFNPKETESTVEGIKKQIEMLNSIQETHLGYLNIITNAPEDAAEALTEHQLMKLCQWCQILSLALSTALDHMPQWKTWNRCCQEAVKIM